MLRYTYTVIRMGIYAYGELDKTEHLKLAESGRLNRLLN
jgi:hypothetical protein